MEFRILGPIEVLDDGVTLPVGGSKQRALLAILLLHANEAVSADRLVEMMWADDAPASGAAALHVRVSQLRKALGAGGARVVTKPPGYALSVEKDELDLHRFQRLLSEADGAEPGAAALLLREALSLWRGSPLADMTYEAFAQPAIGRLDELRLLALEKRIDADLALGRAADLVGELELVTSEHPLRERLRGQLMLSLYQCGRQAEALSAYREMRLTLVETLGMEPSPALQDLERAMLRQDPSLRMSSSATPERSILVVVRRPSDTSPLLELAEPLARRPPKEIVLAHPVEVAAALADASTSLNSHRSGLIDRGVTARAAAFVSTTPAEDLIRLAVEQDVDLLLLDGSPRLFDDALVASLFDGAPCDVAVRVGASPRPGPVLVPFVGADHDWAAVELGAWIAAAGGSTLLIAGTLGDDKSGRRDGSRLLASASLVVQRALGVAAEPLLVEPGPDAIVAAATGAGVVAVGLSDRWRAERLGTVREALVSSGEPTLVVRRGLRPGGLAPERSLTRFTWTVGPAGR